MSAVIIACLAQVKELHSFTVRPRKSLVRLPGTDAWHKNNAS